MQGSQYGATAKGGKFNFKTVLVKGILWALIGAFVGFGISELCEGITDKSVVAKVMGYSELGDYYMALRYFFGVTSTSVSDEMARAFGNELMLNLRLLDNPYAKKFCNDQE
jgi:hypothetical protein